MAKTSGITQFFRKDKAAGEAAGAEPHNCCQWSQGEAIQDHAKERLRSVFDVV
jgi:hypothetical protein